jgi:hypothetical protein
MGMIYSTVTSGLQLIAKRLRIRSIIRGIFIVWMSTFFYGIGLVMLFITLFFHFAKLTQYIIPGLYTAFVAIGLGIIFYLLGMYFIKYHS